MPTAITQEEVAMYKISEAVIGDLDEGKSKHTIAKKLVREGWLEDAAIQFVNDIEGALNEYKNSPAGRRLLAGRHWQNTVYGVLWAVGGAVLTAVTFNPESGSVTFIIGLGLTAFGVIECFKGLLGWWEYK